MNEIFLLQLLIFLAEDAGDHGAKLNINILWHLFNILILVYLLHRILRKIVPIYLGERRKGVEESLVGQEHRIAEKEKILEETNARYGRLLQTREDRLKKEREESLRIAEDMIRKGEKEAGYLIEIAEKEIERYRRAEIERVRDDAIEDAFERLKREIENRLDEKGHEIIITKCLELMEGKG